MALTSTAISKLPEESQRLIATLINNPGSDQENPASWLLTVSRYSKTPARGANDGGDEAFCVALGADCFHCHVADQWDDDHEAKEIVRKMVRTVRDINQQLFDGQHQGDLLDLPPRHATPEAMPNQPPD